MCPLGLDNGFLVDHLSCLPPSMSLDCQATVARLLHRFPTRIVTGFTPSVTTAHRGGESGTGAGAGVWPSPGNGAAWNPPVPVPRWGLGVGVRVRQGDLLRVDRRASVQFAGGRELTFRVIAIGARPTYEGWAWLTGYVLNEQGEAVERREIYVQRDGLYVLRPAQLPRQATAASGAARRTGEVHRD